MEFEIRSGAITIRRTAGSPGALSGNPADEPLEDSADRSIDEFEIRSGAMTIRRPADTPDEAVAGALEERLLADGDDGSIRELDPDVPVAMSADDDDAEGVPQP